MDIHMDTNTAIVLALFISLVYFAFVLWVKSGD